MVSIMPPPVTLQSQAHQLPTAARPGTAACAPSTRSGASDWQDDTPASRQDLRQQIEEGREMTPLIGHDRDFSILISGRARIFKQ